MGEVKILKFFRNPFPEYEVFVGMNCKYEEFVEYINKTIKPYIDPEEKLGIETNKAKGTMVFKKLNRKGIVSGIWIKKYDFNIGDESVLGHEVCHLVDYISDEGGFEDEKEFRAYLTEYITYQIKKIHLDKYNKLFKTNVKVQKKTNAQREGKRTKGGKDKKRNTKKAK